MAKIDNDGNGKKVVIEYLTRHEAARFLRVSLSWLDHHKEIPFHKLGKGRTSRILYKLEDLRKYIEMRRVEV